MFWFNGAPKKELPTPNTHTQTKKTLPIPVRPSADVLFIQSKDFNASDPTPGEK